VVTIGALVEVESTVRDEFVVINGAEVVVIDELAIHFALRSLAVVVLYVLVFVIGEYEVLTGRTYKSLSG